MMGTRKKLGEILLEAGLLDGFQLQAALGHQRQWGGRLGEIVVSKGFTSEDALAECLAAQLDLPRMDLYAVGVDPQAAKLLPADMAERHGVVPVQIEGHEGERGAFVWVATADPTNLSALDEVQFRSGKRVRAAVVTASQLEAALRHAYHGAPLEPPPERGIELDRETRELPGEEMFEPPAGDDADLPFLDAEEVDVSAGEVDVSMDEAGAAAAPPARAAAEPSSVEADMAALGLGDELPAPASAAPAAVVRGTLVENRPPDLAGHEQAILDALDALAAGEEAPAEVQRFVNPTQMVSALVRLLIRKGVIDEAAFVEELQRK
jgi:hypothetical protein